MILCIGAHDILVGDEKMIRIPVHSYRPSHLVVMDGRTAVVWRLCLVWQAWNV